MTYLHTDERLNARARPTVREQELIDSIDGVLTRVDPPGIVRGEALWYLGPALEGDNNTEIVLPLSWDRELPLRLLLTEQEGFSVGWGGELSDPLILETFATQGATVKEMTFAFEQELSREIRLSRRRILFGGPAEFHIRHAHGWIDLSRGAIPSTEARIRAAKRAVTLRG